jgi:signal transduction histidine kinase
MEKMRDIVWALDARKDSYDDLITRMREYAENTIGRKDIQYKFDINITSSLQSINPEQRQNIYLIYKEALANIIKHSNCTEVVITLHKSIGETIMTISDNGSLTKNAQMSSGQGLSNIEMRARRIGGTIHIDSSHGFSITLTIKQ